MFQPQLKLKKNELIIDIGEAKETTQMQGLRLISDEREKRSTGVLPEYLIGD